MLWSAAQVGAWLSTIQLPQYADTFQENDIDGEMLRIMSRDDIKELVTSVGHRMKILAYRNALFGGLPDLSID